MSLYASSDSTVGGLEPIVELRDVTFQYRAQSQPTLTDINLTIYRGQKVAIVGQSGSGKSTLANLISGLIPHRYAGIVDGSIRVAGMDPSTTPLHELSQRVGTVLQDPDGQFVSLTVAEDIAFSLENAECDHREMVERTRKAAESVHIDHLLDSSPHDLSGGQKQRVSMAGVLVDEVDILLFDEPLASLDPASGHQAVDLIADLHARYNTTVIIIEHRLEDILRCDLDRIIVMDRGRIIADGDCDQIIASQILTDHGIREPLFVTAVRMAGHSPTSEECPSHVDKIRLDPVASTLRQWSCEPPLRREPTEVILSARNVNFSINDTPILSDISFDICAGDTVALCGTNGAGKSTLARLICGFDRPDSGRIICDGVEITDSPIAQRAEKIGFVIQNPNQMISQPLILDEVGLALAQRGITGSEAECRIEEVLKICGLWAYRSWPISALSFGQRKRVTIASVLVMDPKIIILDEPTAGQDWAHYTDIMEFLRSLADSQVTIILITHDMHLALEYTSTTMVMHDGHLIASDRSSAILADLSIAERASLATTSLTALAKRVGIDHTDRFIEQFIVRERQWRSDILRSHLGTGR